MTVELRVKMRGIRGGEKYITVTWYTEEELRNLYSEWLEDQEFRSSYDHPRPSEAFCDNPNCNEPCCAPYPPLSAEEAEEEYRGWVEGERELLIQQAVMRRQKAQWLWWLVRRRILVPLIERHVAYYWMELGARPDAEGNAPRGAIEAFCEDFSESCAWWSES
tara:strand:- start:50 stop:538 length:489 start_codon:yes stop_codon:yes gene_type:complete